MTPVNLTVTARSMRRSMTPAETVFWTTVRNRRFGGYKFRRQVCMGHYIVDFVCEQHRLVVEIDGSQHGDAIEYDARRTQWLIQRGYSVMRFSNQDVLTGMEGVARAVEAALRGELWLGDGEPSPALRSFARPLPRSGRGEE